MEHFESPTQYDRAYLGIENNRSVCSFFSLLTLAEWLKKPDPSREEHLKNLDVAVGNYLAHGIRGHLSFFELLEFAEGIAETETMATSTMMVREKVLGYDAIFKDSPEKPYGIIFLKSSKFFVVLVEPKESGVRYHVRDCHDSIQMSFDDRPGLEQFLKTRHEFETDIVVDGHVVGEFSNIEFLVWDTEFPTRFDPDLHPPKKSTEEVAREEKEHAEIEKAKKESETGDGISDEEKAMIEAAMKASGEHPAEGEEVDPDVAMAMKLQFEMY